ncbi:MAG: addiction module protein [Pyrinomonadaceae bacterium]
MNTHLTEILELSVVERIQIVEDIWDSIAVDSENIEVSDD